MLVLPSPKSHWFPERKFPVEVLLKDAPNKFDVEVNAGSDPLRVTIAWNDEAATPLLPSLDPPDLMLVNDLDLRITRVSDGTSYHPYVLDPDEPVDSATTGDNFRDNVEQVYVANPATGTYTISISHKGWLASGTQDVSLIVTGNSSSEGVEDPPVQISCSNPAPSNKIRVGGVDANKVTGVHPPVGS